MNKYRVIIYALLELQSPLHLGSGKSDNPFTDQPVLRNLAGLPFLPGSTMVGSLDGASHFTSDQRNKWLGQSLPKQDNPRASSLIMDDALPIAGQRHILQWPLEIRSLNTLLRDSLTVRQGSSFNMEVIPVGTRFCFGCRCDLEDEKDRDDFLNCIESYLSRGGQVGGQETTGLGRWTCKNSWSLHLDMTNQSDLLCWLRDLHGLNWQGDNTILTNLGFSEISLPDSAPDSDWIMEMDVDITEGLHLSAGSSGLPQKGEPDLGQARQVRIDEQGEISIADIDYGSTVRGRLRTAMEILLRTYLITFEKCPAEEVNNQIVPHDPTQSSSAESVNRFFGYANKGRTGGKKSCWKVEETPWKETTSSNEDHIHLNEFTQQVMQSAKFDFSPLSGGKNRVRIILSGSEMWHRVLIYYAGKLLEQNVLPWGGHGSRGYLGAKIRISGTPSLAENPPAVLQKAVREIAGQCTCKKIPEETT